MTSIGDPASVGRRGAGPAVWADDRAPAGQQRLSIRRGVVGSHHHGSGITINHLICSQNSNAAMVEVFVSIICGPRQWCRSPVWPRLIALRPEGQCRRATSMGKSSSALGAGLRSAAAALDCRRRISRSANAALPGPSAFTQSLRTGSPGELLAAHPGTSAPLGRMGVDKAAPPALSGRPAAGPPGPATAPEKHRRHSLVCAATMQR